MTTQSTAFGRLAVGLVQGVALWFLHQAFEANSWPATDGLVFAPLLAVAMFVPIIVLVGLGNLRPRTLVPWTILATALCAGLAFHDIFRAPIDGPEDYRNLPSVMLWLALAAALFILDALIEAGDADRKWIAGYGRYFDVAWTRALQLVLASLFVGVFWAVLWLGAELFRLIKLEFLSELIRHRWFWVPVTTVVFACAIHVTDTRAGLVRGTRTLSLTLLSWLLPVLTLLTVAFLLALPFTGLEPLWNTRRATAILLTAAVVLVFLLNNAYQDGRPEHPVAAPLRYSGDVAAVALVPLVALAAYGLWLRVHQYGWTANRIVVAACIAVAACYALGYALAAIWRGRWLRSIEITNVLAAFVMLVVLLALTTPLADPARLAVADQLARLESGKTPVDRFDFAFLRFDSGRYGREALERLKAKQDGPDAARIAQKAGEALAATTRPYPQPVVMRATPASRIANITVLGTPRQPLPDSFVQQEWQPAGPPFQIPRCLVEDAKCEAVLADLDGHGTPEILLFSIPGSVAVAFKVATDGKWTPLGLVANTHCAGVRDALRAGKFETAVPRLKEIEVNGQRLRVNTECLPARR